MRRLLAVALLLFFARPAAAQTAPNTELESAKALRMGGAFRAASFLDASSVDLNPAAMSVVKKFDFEAGWIRDPDTRDYGLELMMADSLTNATSTGFDFEYRSGPRDANGKAAFQSQRYLVTAGSPIVPDQMWIGVSTKYVDVSYDGGPTTKVVTGDLSLEYKPVQYVVLAATMDNLVNGNQPEAPRSVTGGLAVLPAKWLLAEGDFVADLASTNTTKTTWMAGLQWTPAQSFALRGGWNQSQLTKERYWTLGAGFQGQTMALDYAMRVPEGSKHAVTHYLTLSILHF